MRAKRLILLAASIPLVAVWGCSSSMDSDKNNTVGDDLQEQIAASGFVGADRCIDCHQGFSWSSEIVQAYLEGKHVIHSDHINAESDAVCLQCHDPIGDGQLIEGYINPADVPAEGLAAVTCEVCHGTGAVTDDEGGHWGIGPMPNPTPDYNACGECHNNNWTSIAEAVGHLVYHPEGNNIVDDYVSSPHFEADGRNEARCVKCHNDEGARLYKNIHTAEQLYAHALPLDGEVSPVQCRTCHDPHNNGELLLGEGEIEREFTGDDYDASAEYRTCTNCHQPHNSAIITDQAELDAGAGDSEDGPNGDLIYHGKRWNRVIANTHYDDPLTNDDTGLERIEGYAMDPEDERVCRNCHNQHAADNTINEQWAESAHGGHILTIKEDAAAPSGDPIRRTLQDIYNVRTAGSESSWAGHMWPTDDEAECQRCHTATGAKSFLNGPTTYYTAMDAFIAAEDIDPDQTAVPSPNDFSYLEEGQQELLFCWACHTDNVGGMRNPGSVWLQDRAGDLFGPVPDIGKSNVCVGCHGGRANGEYIRNTAAEDRSSSGRVHHLPAAGALFSAVTHTAYEFLGLNYVSASLLHDKIGRNLDSPETGIGPCASCHMPDEDHHFEAVEKDDSGIITAITNQALCADCHGASMDPARLNTLSAQYQDVIAYLDTVTSGDNYAGENFDNTTFIRSRGDDVAGKNDYGALQNDEFVRTDGGEWGYVHNSTYVRRIIFDTLDWMDNAALDGTITIPSSYPKARIWLNANSSGIATRP